MSDELTTKKRRLRLTELALAAAIAAILAATLLPVLCGARSL